MSCCIPVSDLKPIRPFSGLLCSAFGSSYCWRLSHLTESTYKASDCKCMWQSLKIYADMYNRKNASLQAIWKAILNAFQGLCQVGSNNIEHYTSTLQREDANNFAVIPIFAIAKEKLLRFKRVWSWPKKNDHTSMCCTRPCKKRKEHKRIWLSKNQTTKFFWHCTCSNDMPMSSCNSSCSVSDWMQLAQQSQRAKTLWNTPP